MLPTINFLFMRGFIRECVSPAYVISGATLEKKNHTWENQTSCRSWKILTTYAIEYIYGNVIIEFSRKFHKIPLYSTLFYNVQDISVVILTLTNVCINSQKMPASWYIRNVYKDSFKFTVGVQLLTVVHCILSKCVCCVHCD